MKYTKQEIIDMIREQHERDLDSLIDFLDRNMEGDPYKHPESGDD